MATVLDSLGHRLARFLTGPARMAPTLATYDPRLLAGVIRPGDVLLVEGNSKVSVAIKYLTQSTWSHAALYVGDAPGPPPAGEEPRVLIEADLNAGGRAVPLSEYAERHTRICRPVGLSPEDLQRVIDYAVGRIGHQYDLRNLIDISPYFRIVKPTIESGFDYRALVWKEDGGREPLAA
jgi:hypothetical protein